MTRGNFHLIRNTENSLERHSLRKGFMSFPLGFFFDVPSFSLVHDKDLQLKQHQKGKVSDSVLK